MIYEYVHGQAVGLALDVDAERSSRGVVTVQALEDRVGHHDLTGPRAPLEPSRRVDNVADGREVLDRPVADIPHASDAEVDPDADRQRLRALGESSKDLLGASLTITSHALSRSEAPPPAHSRA